MRISFFVPRCTLDNSHGRYVIELSRRFCRDHDVTVYAGTFWAPLRQMVRCRRLPVPRRPAVARLAGLWIPSFVLPIRKRGGILHNQGADAPIGNIVTAQFCNKAMMRIAGRDAGFYRRFNYATGVAVEKYCMTKKSTKRVIAVSHRVKQEIEQEYAVDPARIVVIHHGVDTDAFRPELKAEYRSAVRVRLGIAHDDFVVLFVGGDYRRKGLTTLLCAVAGLRSPVRVLVVEVQPDPQLRELLANQQLTAFVTFVGSSTEMAPLYAAADCFVLPTHYDTFSLATLEAMSSGLPVVVSRAAGVAEIVDENRDSLILERADDVETLTHYLTRLVEDASLRSQLAIRARETATRHTWDRVATETLAVYHDVLDDSLGS